MNKFQEQFLGAWSLQDYRFTRKDTGFVSYPYGEDAEGHILYTPQGVMSATIMRPGRKLHTTDRTTRLNFSSKLEDSGLEDISAEEEEIALTYLESVYGFMGYAGTFEADENDVHHHVQQAIWPNFVGTTATRAYRFEGDLLHLTADGADYIDALVWKRC